MQSGTSLPSIRNSFGLLKKPHAPFVHLKSTALYIGGLRLLFRNVDKGLKRTASHHDPELWERIRYGPRSLLLTEDIPAVGRDVGAVRKDCIERDVAVVPLSPVFYSVYAVAH